MNADTQHPSTPETGQESSMNAIAKQEPATQTQVVEFAAPSTIMEVIARAAADPTVDIEKLDRLLGMHERITAREAEQAYNDAMNAAQAEMGRVRTDAHNPQTKSRYASYPALDRELRPIYTRHGFSLSFYSGDDPPTDHVRVVCKVAHRNGHSERPHVDMPADGKGAKGGDVMTKTHAAGSAFSYGQRYLLKLIFNIAVGEDDDGNSAGGRPTEYLSVHQQKELSDLMDTVGADRDKFLNFLHVEGLHELPVSKFKAAKAALEAKRSANRKAEQ